MKRELVLAEWRRAQQALGAAELLTDCTAWDSCRAVSAQQALGAAELLTREGYHADAVARTYYALFHAAKAALHARDVAAETHAGVRRMFGLHLIKPGEIEPEWSTPLGETLDERLAADYDPEVSFSAKEARGACREARAFVGRIRR